jgi:hypothetical protein
VVNIGLRNPGAGGLWMPALGDEGTGGNTVFTAGPGTAFRAPLYTKIPLAGSGGQFTYVPLANALGLVDYASLALDVFQKATVTIPTASVITLHSVPVNLSLLAGGAGLAAPGAGAIIMVDYIAAELVYNSATYAAGGALTITYGTGGGVAHGTAIPAALVTATATEVFLTPGGMTAQLAASAAVNAALWIQAATQDFTTGNSPLNLQIGYRILTGF